MKTWHFALIAIGFLAALVLMRRPKPKPPAPSLDPNVAYRRQQKCKAWRAMSMHQRLRAAELGEGDVADLEWDGQIAVIIMEATCSVYEWDGFDWIDRNPHKIKQW